MDTPKESNFDAYSKYINKKKHTKFNVTQQKLLRKIA